MIRGQDQRLSRHKFHNDRDFPHSPGSGLQLIFVRISTLNYVGAPRNKLNQVSGISNFMRNTGGRLESLRRVTFLFVSVRFTALLLLRIPIVPILAMHLTAYAL